MVQRIRKEKTGVRSPSIQASPPPTSATAAAAWSTPGTLSPIHPNGSLIFDQPWNMKADPAATRTASSPSDDARPAGHEYGCSTFMVESLGEGKTRKRRGGSPVALIPWRCSASEISSSQEAAETGPRDRRSASRYLSFSANHMP